MSPRAQILIGLLAAFLFGSTAGLIGGFMLARAGGPRFMPRHRAATFESYRPLRGAIERELDLDDSQRERFREILDRQRAESRAMRESTRVELERILTPEQRERWRELDERWKRERQMRRGGPRGMRGGPPPEGP